MKSAKSGEKKRRMKMLRVALALLTGTATSLPPPPSCSHLQHAYGARGVPRDAVPRTPVSGDFCFSAAEFNNVEVEFHWSVKLTSSCPSFGKAKEGGEVDQKCAQEICPIFHPCQNSPSPQPPLYHTVHGRYKGEWW